MALNRPATQAGRPVPAALTLRCIRDGRGDQTALIFDSAMVPAKTTYTYAELLEQVSLFAGVLKDQGVVAGFEFALSQLASLFGASFGVLARSAGFDPVASIVMSATTFAGSAQFAAVSVLGAGDRLEGLIDRVALGDRGRQAHVLIGAGLVRVVPVLVLDAPVGEHARSEREDEQERALGAQERLRQAEQVVQRAGEQEEGSAVGAVHHRADRIDQPGAQPPGPVLQLPLAGILGIGPDRRGDAKRDRECDGDEHGGGGDFGCVAGGGEGGEEFFEVFGDADGAHAGTATAVPANANPAVSMNISLAGSNVWQTGNSVFEYAITPDGAQKWKFTTGDWVDSSPVVAPDGTIYAAWTEYNGPLWLARSTDRGTSFSELATAELGDEAAEVLQQSSWLESKVSEGGTSSARVREQLEQARALLG